MNTQQAHAQIVLPVDCFPLVAELVSRLGGHMTEATAGGFPIAPMADVERGGKMLRALRLRAGMTQQAVSEALGLPQSHISEFENGRRSIPYKHAQTLAGLLYSIPSHFMTPNAETIAAMNEDGKDRPTYDTPSAMYNDLGI